MPCCRSGGCRRNAILEFRKRFARQNDGLEIRGRRFVRLRLARPGIHRRSVFGRRQIAPGGPAVAPAAWSLAGASPAFVAPTSPLSAAISKAAAAAVIALLEGRTLAALHGLRWLHAA